MQVTANDVYYFSAGVDIRLSQPIYSIMEPSERLQVSIISSHPLQNPYQIRLKCISGNATSKYSKISICIVTQLIDLTGGEDFGATRSTVTFVPGATVANFTVPITDDKIFEGTEIFTIQITRTYFAKQLEIRISDPNTALGEIVDESKASCFL